MIKRRIYSPGPVEVSPDTALEMARPILHHRTGEFEAIIAEVVEGLKFVFQTRGDVLLFASSGTGAMEGAVTNLLNPGDKALCVVGGKFGQRWSQLVSRFGALPVNIDVPWGKAVNPDDVARALEADPVIKAVYIQACETSTGVAHPVRDVARIVRGHENTVLVVDAISAVGVMNLPADDWGLDVVVGGSQKAWQLPPGLAFASVSPKAWKLVDQCVQPRFYFDWKTEKKSIGKNTTAYTPAVSLIMGLRKVLADIREEGLESLFSRAALYARMFRAAMEALGLGLFAPDSPSDSITAVCSPEGMDARKVVRHLSEKYHITIAAGQDQIKETVFRVSHMGYLDGLDMITAVAAVEITLKDLGWNVELGAGVKKAQEILTNA
ncbi:MAG: alanine--glyoxylate aminotransferase family protein [Proteobacteria bacterium]|nr:alanine--glyoxylate aminotransferase family protein [Pseudomonadota bacterium]